MNYDEITDVELLQRIGGKLKEIRLEQNIKQKELAEKAGLSMFSISQMETGHNTSMQSIIQVLRALGRMDMLDAFIINNVEASPMADRQRVSRATPTRQHIPIAYSLQDDDDDYYAIAAEPEMEYGVKH